MSDDPDDALFGDDLDDVLMTDVAKSLNMVNQPSLPLNFEELDGFDMIEGKHWIYPVNYPLRSYQFNIVQKALFWNTLVTLPTGLGKTFIAAVVIYNYYRWYPRGKILFMAPTKPLVAQQIRACHDIVGIPQKDLGELTGNLNPAKRDKIWSTKRVFFLTPQIVQNDLGRGMCPAAEVVLVVIDEAHKATGNHAYCQVIRELQNYTTKFRVLALSATPGDNLITVQSVLTNLLIAHVEIRSEESIDIQPYTHNRKMDKIILPLDQPLNHIKQTFLTKVLDKYVQTLITHRALYCTDISCLTKFTLLQQRQSWRNRNNNLPGQVASMLEGVYFVLMNLYHAFELLLIHGAGVFIHYCLEMLEGKKGNNGTKGKLLRDQDFLSLVDKIQRWRNSGIAYELNNVPFVDHPKLAKLLEILTKHFTNCDTQTRAMVFSSYRDSVQDLVKRINKHNDKIRSTLFIGQSGTHGLKQKQQLETVSEFKKGTYNVLVATCVGEEGLDIGMVDLIVCYDASASPTRLVQRMGRAARKRDGSIVVLLTEGKEESTFKKSISSKKSVSKAVITKLNKLALYQNNPRMIPRHLNPTPDKRVLQPVQFKTPPPKSRQKSTAQKQKCPYLSSTQYNSYVGAGGSETDLDKSARFSLTECLSNWIHWQGTEHPTFDVEHSMGTLTLVHVMTVNDFFKSESAAIQNYEDEMEQYLNLDDVIVKENKNKVELSEPSKPVKPVKSNLLNTKKEKRPQIVISDDDDDEFESKTSFKQSKLNFGVKTKDSLFSCLPKTQTRLTGVVVKSREVKSENVEELGVKHSTEMPQVEIEEVAEFGKKAKFEGTEVENKVAIEEVENKILSPEEDDLPELDICDVQHDVSFEDLISQRDSDDIQACTSDVDEKENIVPNEVPQSCPNVEDLKDLKENELSISLFEAINETWDFELSQKGPDFVDIPAPPSQVPSLEFSDFSFTCSQTPDTKHPEPSVDTSKPSSTSSSKAFSLKTPKFPLLPKPGLTDLSPDFSSVLDTADETLITGNSTKPDNLFESLVRMEKEQTEAEDLLDDMSDLSFSDLLSQQQGEDVKKDPGVCDSEMISTPSLPLESSISTPAQIKPFLPLESSTPAVIQPPANLLETTESKDFVTPQVKHCLKRVKKKPNLADKNPSTKSKVGPAAPLLSNTYIALPSNTSVPLPSNTSTEDSPLNIGKRKRRCNILCTQIPGTSEDAEQSNSSKKSRLFSPDKTESSESVRVKENLTKSRKVRSEEQRGAKSKEQTDKGKSKKGGAACPYVLNEAELSGDEEEEEGEEEDLMSSSLEDFIDQAEEHTGSKTLYLQDIAQLDRQTVRTVGNNFKGNVYSQDPRLDYQGEEVEGEFDDFIDDEEYSLLDDDFEETAVFTQQLPHRTPTPTVKKKRKRRVKEFVESPVSMTTTTRPSTSTTPLGVSPLCRSKSEVKSPAEQVSTPRTSNIPENPGRRMERDRVSSERNKVCSETSRKSTESVNVSSFLIGLDDLLPDNEDTSHSRVPPQCQDAEDDDFETPTQYNRSKRKVNPASKDRARKNLSTSSAVRKNLSTSSAVKQTDSTLDLFGDSFDESMINAACETLNQAPVSKTVKQTSHNMPAKQNLPGKQNLPAEQNLPAKQKLPAKLSHDERISSQFNIDLDDLLCDDEPGPSTKHVSKTKQDNVSIRAATTADNKKLSSSQFDIDLNDLLSPDPPEKENTADHDTATSVPPLDRGTTSNFSNKTGNESVKKSSVTSNSVQNTSAQQPESLENCLVFARTKVISNNQICTMLRTRYKIKVEIRADLGHCDYVVNSNTAVLRITLLDVYKGIPDLLIRVQTLQRSFQHIVLVSELPQPPPGKKKRTVGRSETYDAVRFALTEQKLKHYNTTLLLSGNQDQTAEIISRYIRTPYSQTIPNTTLSDKQSALETFLITVPCLNHGNCRLLALKYSSLSSILTSKAEELSKQGGMTRLNTALFIKYCKTSIRDQIKQV